MTSAQRIAAATAMIVLCVSASVFVVRADPRYSLVVVGYAVAAVAGFVAGHTRRAAWVAGLAAIACVGAPRVVQRDFPEPAFTTSSGPYLAALAVGLIGVALARSSTDERRVTVLPALLVLAGVLLRPELLLEPTMAWLAASGALFVLGLRWRPRRGGLLLVAWALGAASVLLLVPGFQGEIAVLASGTRAFGVFGNPLVAADSLILMASALVAILWRRKLVTVGVVAITVAAVVETGSRTGLMLIGVAALAVLLGVFPGRRERRAVGARAVTALLAAVGLVYLVNASSELGRIGAISAQDESVVGRLSALAAGAREALTHPIGTTLIEVRSDVGNLSTYENIFFDTAARYGWLPLAALIVALALIWRRSGSAARVQWFLLVLAGLTAAVVYFPAVYVVGVLTIGVVQARAEGTSADDADRLEVGDETPEHLDHFTQRVGRGGRSV